MTTRKINRPSKNLRKGEYYVPGIKHLHGLDLDLCMRMVRLTDAEGKQIPTKYHHPLEWWGKYGPGSDALTPADLMMGHHNRGDADEHLSLEQFVSRYAIREWRTIDDLVATFPLVAPRYARFLKPVRVRGVVDPSKPLRRRGPGKKPKASDGFAKYRKRVTGDIRRDWHYDPELGKIYRVHDSEKGSMRLPMSTLASEGMAAVRWMGVRWGLHQIAWWWMTGEAPVRPVRVRDGDPSNIKWENLYTPYTHIPELPDGYEIKRIKRIVGDKIYFDAQVLRGSNWSPLGRGSWTTLKGREGAIARFVEGITGGDLGQIYGEDDNEA